MREELKRIREEMERINSNLREVENENIFTVIQPIIRMDNINYDINFEQNNNTSINSIINNNSRIDNFEILNNARLDISLSSLEDEQENNIHENNLRNERENNIFENIFININNLIEYDIRGPIKKEILKQLPKSKIIEVNKLNDENKRCIICLEDFKCNDIIIYLPCFHIFHDYCIIKWLRKNATCPICKSNINKMVKIDI